MWSSEADDGTQKDNCAATAPAHAANQHELQEPSYPMEDLNSMQLQELYFNPYTSSKSAWFFSFDQSCSPLHSTQDEEKSDPLFFLNNRIDSQESIKSWSATDQIGDLLSDDDLLINDDVKASLLINDDVKASLLANFNGVLQVDNEITHQQQVPTSKATPHASLAADITHQQQQVSTTSKATPQESLAAAIAHQQQEVSTSKATPQVYLAAKATISVRQQGSPKAAVSLPEVNNYESILEHQPHPTLLNDSTNSASFPTSSPFHYAKTEGNRSFAHVLHSPTEFEDWLCCKSSGADDIEQQLIVGVFQSENVAASTSIDCGLQWSRAGVGSPGNDTNFISSIFPGPDVGG